MHHLHHNNHSITIFCLDLHTTERKRKRKKGKRDRALCIGFLHSQSLQCDNIIHEICGLAWVQVVDIILMEVNTTVSVPHGCQVHLIYRNRHIQHKTVPLCWMSSSTTPSTYLWVLFLLLLHRR